VGETAISWTHRPGTKGRTWNPTKGCSRVSEGCRHCYAERQAARIVRMHKGKPTVYDDLVKTVNGEARWTGKVVLVPKILAEPLGWKEPSTVFVNSMSDLFHEDLTNEQIAAVFGVMAACPQHTFIVLTKRAKRMREWFKWASTDRGCSTDMFMQQCAANLGVDIPLHRIKGTFKAFSWPLPNVWLGVSAENQAAADERIPELLATPAAIRLLSCEPLLGRLDLTLRGSRIKEWDEDWKYDTLRGFEWASPHSEVEEGSSPSLDWVIAGCESGPGARPCATSWLWDLRDQCADAGVPFFLKQAHPWTWAAGDPPPGHARDDGRGAITAGPGSHRKAGGVIELPYLDGVQHKAFPESKVPR